MKVSGCQVVDFNITLKKSESLGYTIFFFFLRGNDVLSFYFKILVAYMLKCPQKPNFKNVGHTTLR